MSQNTLPSKIVPIVEVPEVENFKAEFQYNFFTKDEKINERNNTVPNSIRLKSGESFDVSYIGSTDFNQRTARYIKFFWDFKCPINEANFNKIKQFKIKDNFDKIKTEQFFTSEDYSNVFLQDNGIDGKLKFFIGQIANTLNVSGSSPQDIAKSLNEQTDSEINGSLFSAGLSDPKNIRFFDRNNKQIVNENDLINQFKDISFRFQINNKLIHKTFLSLAQKNTSIFQDEANQILDKMKVLEEKTRNSRPSNIFDKTDYDLEFDDSYLFVKKIPNPNFYNPIIEPIGFIIEKQEIQKNGSTINHKPIIIESPYVRSTVDLEVKYGTTYVYRIKTVSYLETEAENINEPGNYVAVGFLVSSKPSSVYKITCEEFSPPPPPSDFKLSWDYQNDALRVSWAFPPNSQQDVKKFQVFRRKSIDEAYELIKMYDFDDSVEKSPYYETPDNNILEKLTSPTNYFADREFKKDSKFIYCLCSIDAHGISSNYSMQLQAEFDRFKNKIKTSLISVSGAPKTYPNAYLNIDTFVDTIKDEGHKELEIIFNPEYLKVVDNKNNDLRFLKIKENDVYKLQLINIDLQKQDIIEIRLKNQTTGKIFK